MKRMAGQQAELRTSSTSPEEAMELLEIIDRSLSVSLSLCLSVSLSLIENIDDDEDLVFNK